MSTLTYEQINEMVEGRTVVTEFLTTLANHGDRVAVRWKEGEDAWGTMTFSQLAEKVATFAGGLRALGVGPGDRVVMMMRNVPDFHVVDLAALAGQFFRQFPTGPAHRRSGRRRRRSARREPPPKRSPG